MSKFEEFIQTRRAPETVRTYRGVIMRVVGNPDAFLELPKQEAEAKLLDFVLKTRGKLAAYSISGHLSTVKSFCDFYEKDLNWKRVKSVVPPSKRVSSDRAPTVEEIRRLLSMLGNRDRAIVLLMASGGFRIGAFAWLTVGDVAFRPSGIACVRVYRGEPEEYRAFVSSEASAELKEYLKAREQTGEQLGPGSPLFRDKWDVNRAPKGPPPVPTALAFKTVSSMLDRWWVLSGVAAKGNREFKSAHGFRKFFKTQASRGMSRDDVEVLMGHSLAYYRPTLEHLEEEYLKALPLLTIAESEQLKEEIKAQEDEHKAQWTETRLQVLELKDALSEERKARERDAESLRLILKFPKVAEAVRKYSADG